MENLDNQEESNSNETSNVKSNVEEQPKEVSQETLNYLTNILGIDKDSWFQQGSRRC